MKLTRDLPRFQRAYQELETLAAREGRLRLEIEAFHSIVSTRSGRVRSLTCPLPSSGGGAGPATAVLQPRGVPIGRARAAEVGCPGSAPGFPLGAGPSGPLGTHLRIDWDPDEHLLGE